MVIENAYPNLSNIVQTDFELDRVIQTVAAIDPGNTGRAMSVFECCVRVLLLLLLTQLILGPTTTRHHEAQDLRKDARKVRRRRSRLKQR